MNSKQTQRRLQTLLSQLILSKPLQLTTTLASSVLNNNNDKRNNVINNDSSNDDKNHQEESSDKSEIPESKKEEFKLDVNQIIEDLENERLSPSQALDIAHDIIETENQYEQGRQFIFSILPYLRDPVNINVNNNMMEEGISEQDNDDTRRAYRLVGLSYHKNHQFQQALPWFKKAAHNSPSILDWFNLCSTAAQISDHHLPNNNKDEQHLSSIHLKLALHAFQQLEELHKASEFKLKPSFWIQLYYFIISLMNGKHYHQAFELLNRLKLAYKRARFTDPSYLEEIGLMSFDSFLSLTLLLFKRVNRLEQGLEFLNQMKQNVDEAGKKTIDQIIQEYQ
ncbi:hypothetical protein ABK040_013761 [Willaertia magna]